MSWITEHRTARFTGVMARERVSFLAMLALDFGVIAVMAFVLAHLTRSEQLGFYVVGTRNIIDDTVAKVYIIDPGDGLEAIHLVAWLVGLAAALAAICLGHFSRWKGGEFARPPDGMEHARWGYYLGYAWFAVLGALTVPALPWELLVLVGYQQVCRLFIRELPAQWGLSMFLMTLVASVAIVFLVFGLRFGWIIGVSGIVILAFMPGWALFHPGLPAERKLATVVVLYSLVIATILVVREPLLATLKIG